MTNRLSINERINYMSYVSSYHMYPTLRGSLKNISGFVGDWCKEVGERPYRDHGQGKKHSKYGDQRQYDIAVKKSQKNRW